MGTFFDNILNPSFFVTTFFSLISIPVYVYNSLYAIEIDYSLMTIDFINQKEYFSNKEVNNFVYSKYLKKLNKIPFSFNEFCEKSNTGLNNLSYIKSQMINTIENKVWVRNNFRNYNINYVNNLNNCYFNNLRFIFSDYIFNNMLYKHNTFTFNDSGKINVKILFYNNSPYLFNYYYLKLIFSYEMINNSI